MTAVTVTAEAEAKARMVTAEAKEKTGTVAAKARVKVMTVTATETAAAKAVAVRGAAAIRMAEIPKALSGPMTVLSTVKTAVVNRAGISAIPMFCGSIVTGRFIGKTSAGRSLRLNIRTVRPTSLYAAYTQVPAEAIRRA